jgi:hypothetical protein
MEAIIIRGYNTQVKTQTSQAYEKPGALNWRYRIPGESYSISQSEPRNYCPPKAINWRYQVSVA